MVWYRYCSQSKKKGCRVLFFCFTLDFFLLQLHKVNSFWQKQCNFFWLGCTLGVHCFCVKNKMYFLPMYWSVLRFFSQCVCVWVCVFRFVCRVLRVGGGFKKLHNREKKTVFMEQTFETSYWKFWEVTIAPEHEGWRIYICIQQKEDWNLSGGGFWGAGAWGAWLITSVSFSFAHLWIGFGFIHNDERTSPNHSTFSRGFYSKSNISKRVTEAAVLFLSRWGCLDAWLLPLSHLRMWFQYRVISWQKLIKLSKQHVTCP